ncbi:hypothetical protein LWI29_027381 [Acer saccharum]|uniref:RPW8 domain-containing protein n=1 Tax=Acer saccharum TaxID=4024 RepID=A0AA39TJW6_ACESA|nr:hypothetical protein LWI29_027381 [Acer saccharum]
MAEAVTGIVVEGISRSILMAVKTVIKFESTLENLRRNVQSLNQNIKRITQLQESADELPDQINRLVLLLKEAEELIKKCSRIAWWNYFKKYRYAKRLTELDASLSGASMDFLAPILVNILQIQNEIVKLKTVAGIVVEGISRSILKAVKTVIKFESTLENLRRNVQSLNQSINRILQESADELPDQINRLVLLLKEAEELIKKCSRIAWWNYFKKYRYAKRLIELDASLSGASMDFLAPIWVNILQIQNEIVKLSKSLESVLHDRNAHGGILKRSKTKVVYLASGLKKIVQSIPSWIYPYLSWLLRIHRRGCGYQRFGG